MIASIFLDYSRDITAINLFENYTALRAQELFNKHKLMLEHGDFKKWVYFQEDKKETLERIHRQANDHKPSDYKDSELIL